MNTQTLTIEQPNNIRLDKVVVGLLMLPIILATIVFTTTFWPVAAGEVATPAEQELVALTNVERQKAGMNQLTFNPALYRAAEAKANDMFTKGYFDHFSPTGATPWQFINTAGYQYSKAGENLAIDFSNDGDIIPAWMASPTHRANLLKKDYQDIAIARVKGVFDNRETTIVVQMFGEPTLSLRSFGQSVLDSITSPLPF